MARSVGGFGYWAVVVLAVVLVLFGVPILAGGVWLITLGGSWYYALAGIGLLITAWFLFKHSMLAVWVYLLTFAGTLAWALWERGFNGWAQVPRLVAPTIILILVLSAIPALRGRFAGGRAAVATVVVGVLGLGVSGLALVSVQQSPLLAQEAVPPEAAPPETVPPGAAPPAAAPATRSASTECALLRAQSSSRECRPRDRKAPRCAPVFRIRCSALERRTGAMTQGKCKLSPARREDSSGRDSCAGTLELLCGQAKLHERSS